jgi:hypothetical protein
MKQFGMDFEEAEGKAVVVAGGTVTGVTERY